MFVRKYGELIKKRESNLYEKIFPFEIVHINEPANNMAFTHWHEFMELSYIQKGKGLYEIEEKSFEVKKGNIVIINNIERHRVTYDQENLLYETVIHFAPSLIWSRENSYFDHSYLNLFLYDGARFNNRLELHSDIERLVGKLITEIIDEYIEKKPYYELMIKSKLLTLITHLIRTCGIRTDSEHEYLFRKKNIERIEEILIYINEHFDEEISLVPIAKEFNMCPSYFSDFFKKNMGINFLEYLTRIRINEAIRLLRENLLNSTEIAFHVGFTSLPSFYTAFKRITGKNPGQYRNSLKSKKTE